MERGVGGSAEWDPHESQEVITSRLILVCLRRVVAIWSEGC